MSEITLTLTQLKEYFNAWHSKISHKTEVLRYIDEALRDKNLSNMAQTANTLTSKIKQNGILLSKIISNTTSLSENSSLDDISNELSAKASNLPSSITELETDIRNIENSIAGNVSQNYVDTQINTAISSVRSELGITPKEIETQVIPLDDTAASLDLNNYKTSGLYRNIKSTNNLLHVPEGAQGSSFNLVVLYHASNSVRQILLTSENSANGNRIYMRNYLHSAEGWNEWYELYGSHNLTPLQMKVEWSSGGETIYTLLQK